MADEIEFQSVLPADFRHRLTAGQNGQHNLGLKLSRKRSSNWLRHLHPRVRPYSLYHWSNQMGAVHLKLVWTYLPDERDTLAWSIWRRRHQHRAQQSHYRKRNVKPPEYELRL